MTNFTPNEDRILVLPDSIDDKVGSILIPDTAKDKSTMGKVIAIGDDPVIKYKPGDRIVYGKYAGSTITIDKIDYLIMRNSDVFGSY